MRLGHRQSDLHFTCIFLSVSSLRFSGSSWASTLEAGSVVVVSVINVATDMVSVAS